jgi:polyphosphate kinase
MRFFLIQFGCEDKDSSVVYEPDPLIERRGREAAGD